MSVNDLLFQGFVIPMIQLCFLGCVILITAALITKSKEIRIVCLQIFALIGGVWLSVFGLCGMLSWICLPSGLLLLVGFGFGFGHKKPKMFRKNCPTHKKEVSQKR